MTEQVTEHQNEFFRSMNELRLRDSLCDVCLEVNGKKFSCHRLVLAIVSPYFNTMFNGNFKESNTHVIPIRDVESEAFEEILNAIYTAKIKLLPSNAYCILKASHMMQLETIKNTCISYIMNNVKISYLVDTCLFALTIKRMELYSKCVEAISNDLLTYGRSESFEKIPHEMFTSILLNRCFSDEEEEAVFILISQWCRDNKTSCSNAKTLLEAANLKSTKNIRPIVMADLMVNSNSNEKPIKVNSEADVDTLCLNLYFNGIDMKTCDKGWGILKINDKFDNYTLSSFHSTDSDYQKVCRVGSKVFCLESRAKNNVLDLSCFNEADEEITSKAPPFYFKSFDMIAMDNTLHVLKKDYESPVSNCNCILTYDCERNFWETKFIGFSGKVGIFREKKTEPFTFSDWPNFLGYNLSSLTSSDHILYLIAEKPGPGDTNKYLTSLDIRAPNVQMLGLVKFDHDRHVNAAICAFDKKVALSGSNHQGVLQNTFSIFDITAKRWLYDVEPMQIPRANHNLVYRDGFVYAVENELRFVNNEKYDVKLNKWTAIPCLPGRVAMKCNDDTIAVATGSVFGVDV